MNININTKYAINDRVRCFNDNTAYYVYNIIIKVSKDNKVVVFYNLRDEQRPLEICCNVEEKDISKI